MAHRTWRENRLAMIAAALALLAGTPAILAAAGVKNPWILAGATAAALVIVVFSAVAQNRYGGMVQRRDEQELRMQDGSLVLPDGRLPAVRDITDPVLLGVHPAATVAAVRDGHVVSGAPEYVPRDVDSELRERLAAGGFVLLVGGSTAGKSRTAFEAVRSTLASHLLIRPSGRDFVATAVDRAARERRCVLWLDDLERYLGAGGLTAFQVGRLLTGDGHHRVIMATIRAAERTRMTADAPGDDAGRQASRDIRQVLDQAHLIRMDRMFTGGELKRAETRNWDLRIAEAIGHAGSYGIAEYLAAGPELLGDWQDARDSSEGPHARGAALVAAGIDIRRAGYISPIPRALLDHVHEQYLADSGHAYAQLEPAANAWEWATRPRQATAALLRPARPDPGKMVEVFDYLVDTVQRQAGPLSQVPELIVRMAIEAASPADADSLGATADTQGRYGLAEHAFSKAYLARANDPVIGPDDPGTLASRNNFGYVLYEQGRLDEAETQLRAVLEARTRALGADNPSTLASRYYHALVLQGQGRLDEADTEHRAVLESRIRVLGAEHPDTLTSRGSLASVLLIQGRLDEAETEHRAVLEAMTRVLGIDHRSTLTIRGNLALVLRAQGRLAEAVSELNAVVETRTRVLGPDHPSTQASRKSLARIQRAQRRAEAKRGTPPPGAIS
jgi:tetratricopeptide (TPR) repeat protein